MTNDDRGWGAACPDTRLIGRVKDKTRQRYCAALVDSHANPMRPYWTCKHKHLSREEAQVCANEALALQRKAKEMANLAGPNEQDDPNMDADSRCPDPFHLTIVFQGSGDGCDTEKAIKNAERLAPALLEGDYQFEVSPEGDIVATAFASRLLLSTILAQIAAIGDGVLALHLE